jgi:hypothetical protein
VPALASTSRLAQGHTSATRCRRNDTAPAQTLQAWTPQSEMSADGQQGAAGIEPTIQKNKASQAVAEGGGVGFIENAGGDDEPGGGGGDCSSQRVLIPYETQAEWDALSPRVREQRGRDWDTAMLLLGVRGGNGGVGGRGPIFFDASGCRVYEAADGERQWVTEYDDIDKDDNLVMDEWEDDGIVAEGGDIGFIEEGS